MKKEIPFDEKKDFKYCPNPLSLKPSVVQKWIDDGVLEEKTMELAKRAKEAEYYYRKRPKSIQCNHPKCEDNHNGYCCSGNVMNIDWNLEGSVTVMVFCKYYPGLL